MGRKTAMFGGSFNPIHNGHIELANVCKEQVSLDRILIIPTAVTPNKDNSQMISPLHRLNMCRIACKPYSHLEVSDIEINREGKSYTKDTLKALKNLYPDDELFLIVGADMFLSLLQWKNYEEIFSLATIIASPRDENSCAKLLSFSEKLKNYGAKSIILKNPVMTVSSTEIRRKIQNKEDVSDLLSYDVFKYIANNKLYGCDFSGA